MTRRHRVAAEWVPEEPPKWAACRHDRCGGWRMIRLFVALDLIRPGASEAFTRFAKAHPELAANVPVDFEASTRFHGRAG